MRPFRNRQLKNVLFRSPLQSSAILSLMRIPLALAMGVKESGPQAEKSFFMHSFGSTRNRPLVEAFGSNSFQHQELPLTWLLW